MQPVPGRQTACSNRAEWVQIGPPSGLGVPLPTILLPGTKSTPVAWRSPRLQVNEGTQIRLSSSSHHRRLLRRTVQGGSILDEGGGEREFHRPTASDKAGQVLFGRQYEWRYRLCGRKDQCLQFHSIFGL